MSPFGIILWVILIIIFLCLIYYWFNRSRYQPIPLPLPPNYVRYGNAVYNLTDNSVYKTTPAQYLNNNGLFIRITDPVLTLAIVNKKNNYTCIGLIGQRAINSFTRASIQNNLDANGEYFYSFQKNTNCFPNGGGLEPEWLVTVPSGQQFNDYSLSMTYQPTENPQAVLMFFQNSAEEHGEGPEVPSGV